MNLTERTVNYELIAVKLGDFLKWTYGVNQIERIAKAVFRIQKREFSNENITSVRAQTIYDWIMSLAGSSIPEEEKKRRLILFIKTLIPDENNKVYQEIMNLLGVTKILPPELPDFGKIIDDPSLVKILKNRWYEIQKCLNGEAYLAAIVMMGSLLEGLLLAVVQSHPKEANMAKFAPKNKEGKIKKFYEWNLTDLINVCYECRWIEKDAKDFSLELRDYRNMVHPWHQRTKQFFPDIDTAKICWEVVKAAINDLIKNLKKVN